MAVTPQVTPQDVQKQIDIAIANLKGTTVSGAAFVKQHGTDWTKWPKTSNWYKAFSALMTARKEAGQLTVSSLNAEFSWK